MIKFAIFLNKQGQISIGKKVEVDEYPDGTVVLRPVEIISEFEIKLLKDRAYQHRLEAFDHWEAENKPEETDLTAIEKGIEIGLPSP